MERWVRRSRHLLQVNCFCWWSICSDSGSDSDAQLSAVSPPAYGEIIITTNSRYTTGNFASISRQLFLNSFYTFPFFSLSFCWGINYSLKAYWRDGSRGFVKQPDSTLNEVKEAQGYCSAALDLGLLCLFGSASLQGRLFAPQKAGIISN